ncbi:MAG: DUF294 nucleotidyltransferase-like domain-containing protein [Desulfobacterales bacterium]|jgi:PAS domain S-box-containing protein|nr:DUF294 nucleotidyltransferase-like domain-containing protein [Desulfobacterales bacterium]
MKQSTRVDLHCHSVFSDGELTPELLAARLAKAGVEFAALTDHDSTDGLPGFHEALRRHNIGFVAGVEITAELNGREIHLLAYGFDRHHPELSATLSFLRQERLARKQGPLRRMPSQLPLKWGGIPPLGVTPAGRVQAGTAIELVHRAGGKAFLAHPHVYTTEPTDLTRLLTQLQDLDLDGVELPDKTIPDETRVMISELAGQLGFVLTAGTDFHGFDKEKTALGIDLANDVWKNFIHLIITAPSPETVQQSENADDRSRKPQRPRTWSFHRFSLVLPSLLAIVLFIVTVWGMILPSIEKLLVDRKRDMIRELTNTATSLLAAARQDEAAGLLTGDQARKKAMADIAVLRYGKEGKDYFWIQDMKPRILMHPYRPDLNGTDVADFTDPRGVRIFVEFAQLVQTHGKGFVDYVWQWKDDPTRLAAKESYVSGFSPWGWIIGTGMYIDDVIEEIRRIERSLIISLAAITLLVLFLLLFNIRQSLGVAKKRREAQEDLREAEERYRSLVEATTEGTLLVLEGRCRYGNPTLLRLTGYTDERLELLKLTDLLPEFPENEEILRHLDRETVEAGNFAATITRAGGATVNCLITLNPISLADHRGIILLVKEVLPERAEADSIRRLGLAANNAAIGIFRARADRLGTMVAMNKTAQSLLHSGQEPGEGGSSLAAFFDDDAEYTGFRKILRGAGVVADHYHQQILANGGIRILSLSAILVRSEDAKPVAIDGLIQDATDTMRREKEEKKRVEELRAALALLLAGDGFKGASTVTVTATLKDHRVGLSPLRAEIAEATKPAEVFLACEQLLPKTGMMAQAGVPPRTLTHMISAVCDAATIRFIELAMRDLGPAPAPFTFIAMGSQGRSEQTLVTDQDNALIYERPEGLSEEAAATYFLALGEKVCFWLNRAGYPFCNGKVMASNPHWCKPLSVWKAHSANWIAKAEAKALLEFSICLDFRPIYGEATLAHELRAFINQVLDERPSFLPHLARNALLFKPPFRLLGKIIKSGGPPREAGQLNLKETMLPIVGFARLYALRHRIYQTGTLERIEALVAKNVLEPTEYEAISAAYDVLLHLRLKAQLIKSSAGQHPDNCMAIDNIRYMEEAMVKEAFIRIDAIQKKIINDFLGGADRLKY